MDATSLGPVLGLVVGIATGAALVLAVVSGVLVAGRRRLERELQASRSDIVSLRERLDALTQALERAERSGAPQEFVITSLPRHVEPPVSVPAPVAPSAAGDASAQGEPPVSASLSAGAFATVALTDSVVKGASLVHGVRRALSPENRNRIRFEMGREVKRSRRQRRRDVREARRHLRRSGHLRASRGTDSGAGNAA